MHPNLRLQRLHLGLQSLHLCCKIFRLRRSLRRRSSGRFSPRSCCCSPRRLLLSQLRRSCLRPRSSSGRLLLSRRSRLRRLLCGLLLSQLRRACIRPCSSSRCLLLRRLRRLRRLLCSHRGPHLRRRPLFRSRGSFSSSAGFRAIVVVVLPLCLRLSTRAASCCCIPAAAPLHRG